MADSWHYLDSTGSEFGPFPADTMREWFSQGFFPIGAELPVRLPHWKTHVPLRTCYPDISKAFVGPSAIAEPDAAPGVAGGPPGTQGPPGQAAPGPYSPEQFGGGGYYMMPGAGGMMQGMMPGMMPGMMSGGMQGGKGGMGYGGPMMGGGMMHGDMASLGRLSGRVKSFNAKQGFGFVECPQIHAMFGRDVFLHKAQIGDLKVGTEITFGVEPNKQGMPQARDLLTLDGKAPGPAPSGGFQVSAGKQGGGSKGGGKGGQANRRKGGQNQNMPGDADGGPMGQAMAMGGQPMAPMSMGGPPMGMGGPAMD